MVNLIHLLERYGIELMKFTLVLVNNMCKGLLNDRNDSNLLADLSYFTTPPTSKQNDYHKILKHLLTCYG